MVYERMSLRDLFEQVFSWLLVSVFIFTFLSINAVYNEAVYARYLSNSSRKYLCISGIISLISIIYGAEALRRKYSQIV